MRVLLSDGTGLTSWQSATLLSHAGHRVEALSPDPLCLCQFTRHVRRVHRVPAYGADPLGWLDAALAIADRQHADVLFPTQEQVAVISLAAERLRGAGLLTAVPDFRVLAAVQDKLTAFATLTRLGLPQPPAAVAATRDDLESAWPLPVFVKTAIGTASAGVCQVTTTGQLRRLADQHEKEGVFTDGGVLVQQPVTGPLVMVQSVFAHGELIAFHATERRCEGAGGGASHKRRIELPVVREHITVLGGTLGWHGALSADVILSPDGSRLDGYRASTEELTPLHHDPLTGVPIAIAALATLIRPGAWRHLTSGSVDAYALTPTAWHQLTQRLAATTSAQQT